MALLAEARRHEAEAEAAAARAAPSLGHVPALDGLRGLAVLGVVAFHVGWIDGGYLGVDAFFVLSGFLITSLLLAEHDRRGRIALARFWGRRARRLLPAMLAMVAVVLVWTMAADRAQLGAVRGDAVATLLYVANWHEIATTSSYWAIFDAPSPLQHTWSLAIEEQFYLAWPLVVGGVALIAVRLRRRLAPVLGVVAVGAAAASYALMAALYDEGDASRAYFGTGSRLGAIVLGAALAALLGRELLQPGPALGDRRLDVAAMVALAVLAWAWVSVEGTTPWLYRGGFALLGLAVVVVIAAACRPGIVATGLAWRPLRALGLISYGLYLWHWVVIAILTEARTGLHGLSLDLVQLVISLAAALASFWFLEQPIRTRRWLRTPKLATTAAIGAYGAVFALVGATLLVPGPDLDGLEQRLTAGSTATPDTLGTTAGPGTAATSAPATTAPVPATTAPPTTLAPLPPPRIGVFGDSTAVRTGVGLTEYGERSGQLQVVVNAAARRVRRRPAGRTAVPRGDVRARRVLRRPRSQLGRDARHPADRRRRHPDRHVGDRRAAPPRRQHVASRRRPGDRRSGPRRAAGRERLLGRAGHPRRLAPRTRADRPARAPGTMERFNELLEQVLPEFPLARSVGLDQFVDAQSEADRARLRPDGIHFTSDTAVLVADSWLGPHVVEAAEGLRRAHAHADLGG